MGLDNSGMEVQNKFTFLPVPSLQVSGENVPPLTAACALPPISVYSENVFGTSRKDNTTGNNGKRDNKVQT